MFHPAGSLLKKALVPVARGPAAIRHGLGPKSAALIKMESGFSAHNYHPMPCVFSTAKGAMIRDADGKLYVDFLAGYGAVNHGHLHPAIVKAAKKQLDRCTLSSRAFYSDMFGAFAKKVTSTFKYSSMLPMNTGAEAVETSIKLARRWGYKIKGIRPDKAIIICCDGCFHGRTLAAISMSDDPSSFDFYGPLVPGFIRIPYGDSAALEAVLKKHGKDVAGFLVEPIQGEAGVMIPPTGYFKKVRALCTEHNVLLMADEVQAGVGRTGKLLAIHHEGVRPDVVVLAKALGGGILPVAAVLADKKIMNVFEPGTHGSTFGGNPLASAVGIAALDALKSDKIVEQSASKGKQLAAGLKKLQQRFPHLIHAVRCRGLWGAIETKHDLLDGHAGKKLATLMLKRFVLAKVTHDHTIRLSPPLVITPTQLQWSLARISEALEELSTMVGAKTPKLPAPAKKKGSKASKKKLLPVSVKKAQKKVARKSAKKGGKKH